MKTKSKIFTLALIISSAFFISTTPASAGECSAEDPCMTFAEVDSTGVVVNIIVCQPSVCGTAGSWAGKNPGNGNKLVPQVAANPVTHENSGGYRASADNSPVTESNGRFTLNGDAGPITNTKTIETDNSTTIVNTVINSKGAKTFSYEDTVADPSSISMKPVNELPQNTSADVNITKINKEDNSQLAINESFGERISKSDFENSLNNKYSFNIDLMNLLNINFNIIIQFLDSWFLL